MILAAGRGKRMAPLTDHMPKPLLKVGNKPLIVWHIEHLVQSGIQQIVINHAYLGEKIKQYLGNGINWGASIEYSAENPALETGGGICNALPLLGQQPFLVINGDVWCNIDYNLLQIPAATLAHLVLVPNPLHHPKGDFHLGKNAQLDLSPAPLHTFSGIGIYRPQLFTKCKPSPFPLAQLLRHAIANQEVSGELYRGTWVDVGTPERLHTLNELVRKL